jgi:hypothetical protein
MFVLPLNQTAIFTLLLRYLRDAIDVVLDIMVFNMVFVKLFTLEMLLEGGRTWTLTDQFVLNSHR